MPTWCYKYTPCFCGILLETGTSALELFGDSCMRVLYPIEQFDTGCIPACTSTYTWA